MFRKRARHKIFRRTTMEARNPLLISLSFIFRESLVFVQEVSKITSVIGAHESPWG